MAHPRALSAAQLQGLLHYADPASRPALPREGTDRVLLDKELIISTELAGEITPKGIAELERYGYQREAGVAELRLAALPAMMTPMQRVLSSEGPFDHEARTTK